MQKIPLNGHRFIYAARYGYLDIAKLLISNGANVNAETTYKWTPLHYAARDGYLDIAKLLISNGANVNAENTYKWTPLHIAARYGYLDIAKLLISNGANVNAEDTDKWTPLHYAARYGYLDIAKLLISNGANVNAENTNKWTPLKLAIEYNHAQVANYLQNVIDYDKEIKNKKLSEFLKQLVQDNKINELDDLFAIALNRGTNADRAAFYLTDKKYKAPLFQLNMAEERDLGNPVERILSRGEKSQMEKIGPKIIKELLEKAKKDHNESFEKALIKYQKDHQLPHQLTVTRKKQSYKPDIKFVIKD